MVICPFSGAGGPRLDMPQTAFAKSWSGRDSSVDRSATLYEVGSATPRWSATRRLTASVGHVP